MHQVEHALHRGRLSDHIEAVVSEHEAQPLTDHMMIVDEADPDRTSQIVCRTAFLMASWMIR
jgi:hypothetical protein